MNSDELERLARLLADELRTTRDSGAGRTVSDGRTPRPWLTPTIRPVNSPYPARPEPWSGAGQSLGDIAPVRDGAAQASPHRVDTGSLTAAVRAAAAGLGADRERAAGTAPTARPAGRARGRTGHGWRGVAIPIGVSNRHLHLSTPDAARLLGDAALAAERAISQPGQFAATQRVAVVGPRGRIDGVRIVGPNRGSTQLELAASDARILGIEPPVAHSGRLQSSVGGVKLEGPAGTLDLGSGVIIAGRHLHLSETDARAMALADGDTISVRCGEGSRQVTLHGVLVRSGPAHATELHLDADEAHACGVRTGDKAVIVSRETARSRKARTLITERTIDDLARRGEQIPQDALLTPSARDRAVALGLHVP